MRIVARIYNAAKDTDTFYYRWADLDLVKSSASKIVFESTVAEGQFAGEQIRIRLFGSFDISNWTGRVTREEQVVDGKLHTRLTFGDTGTRLESGPDSRDPLELHGNDHDNSTELGYGHDTAFGYAGNDTLRGLLGNDQILGGSGNDFLSGGRGDDKLKGGADDDVAQGGRGSDTLEGNGGNDSLKGGAGADTIIGGTGEDSLTGDGNGETGRDALDGGRGKDILFGGALSDTLAGGGHADTFLYKKVSDSEAGQTRDIITDFDLERDLIDLSSIDANAIKNGNQSFDFIGNADFSGQAGELRASGSRVAADVDGDGKADFQIDAAGAGSMTEDHFIL